MDSPVVLVAQSRRSLVHAAIHHIEQRTGVSLLLAAGNDDLLVIRYRCFSSHVLYALRRPKTLLFDCFLFLEEDNAIVKSPDSTQ